MALYECAGTMAAAAVPMDVADDGGGEGEVSPPTSITRSVVDLGAQHVQQHLDNLGEGEQDDPESDEEGDTFQDSVAHDQMMRTPIALMKMTRRKWWMRNLRPLT